MTRHSVDKLRNRRIFAEEEKVVVYDNRSRLSTAGKVLEVLGNNTYLVECGKGPQHISGDLMSRVPGSADRDIGGGNIVQQEIGDDNVAVNEEPLSQEDDEMSIASDSSIGSDLVGTYNDNNIVHNRRRRRTRLDQLGPVEANLQRLRPRNR